MMGSRSTNPDFPPPPIGPGEEEPGNEAMGLWGKLILTAFPFLLVLLFLILEWWVRRRS